MNALILSFVAGAVIGCGVSFLLLRWMLNRAFNNEGDL